MSSDPGEGDSASDPYHVRDPEAEAEADQALGIRPAAPAARRRLLGRVAMLALTAICLYLLFPSLVQVFSSFGELSEVQPLWFVALAVLQGASFACVWALQRLALRTGRWFAVATSQLAGNAFSRVVPGGAATGVALQYRMLSTAGVPTTTAASSLTAVSLLTTGVVLALPVLAIPAIVGGAPIDRGLSRAALLGGGVFAVMVGVGAVLLYSDRALLVIGRVVQRLRNAVLRSRDPVTDLPDRLLDERALVRDTLQARWWEAVIFATGRAFFDYGSLLVALLAVGADPNPSAVLLAYVASQVLAMIPITPGGLGFVEAGLTATLALAGVGAANAVVATLAYRMASYWMPLAAGGVAWWLYRSRYRRPPSARAPA